MDLAAASRSNQTAIIKDVILPRDTGITPASPLSAAAVILTGVLTGKDPMALIRVADQPERAYAVGHDIEPDVRVAAIYPDRVVLQNGAMQRTLYLAGANASRGQAPAPSVVQRKNPVVDPDSLTDDGAESSDLAQEIQVQPNRGGGYFVQNVEAGSIYDKLGIQAGDVFFTLDAARIVKLEELSRQAAFADTEEITFEVWRNGQAMLLKYRFDADSDRADVR